MCSIKARSNNRTIISVPRRGPFSRLVSMSDVDTMQIPAGVLNNPEMLD